MLRLTSHGGSCCGINHISSFTGRETVDEIKETISKSRQGRVRGQLIEVVLTNSQLNRSKLEETLKEVGFKKVSSFVNINSGSRCNVFHYHVNLQRHR